MKRLFILARLPFLSCLLSLLFAFSSPLFANASFDASTTLTAFASTMPPFHEASKTFNADMPPLNENFSADSSFNADIPPIYKANTTFNANIPPSKQNPMPGDYACILLDDVYFYAAPDERKGLFLLPKTYYVRLIEYGKEYCKVEYQRSESDALRLTGYTKTKDLVFVEYVPVRPYLYYVFDLTYKIEDNEPNNSSFLTQITVSCVYYGDYQIGSELYCYVLRGKEFGYVPKPTNLPIERNTEYEEYLASLPPEEPETPEETVKETPPTQIAIVVILCLLVPLLVALILKPNRRPLFEAEEQEGFYP